MCSYEYYFILFSSHYRSSEILYMYYVKRNRKCIIGRRVRFLSIVLHFLFINVYDICIIYLSFHYLYAGVCHLNGVYNVFNKKVYKFPLFSQIISRIFTSKNAEPTIPDTSWKKCVILAHLSRGHKWTFLKQMQTTP